MKCIWLTGIPCSGKTTIAKELEKRLSNSIVLDGDDLRNTALGKNVGFSKKDRYNHVLRMGAIAKLFVNNETYAICSFVSPDEKAREQVRMMFSHGDFIEVFVDADRDTCAKRDVKGMWARAMNGEIDNFTGFDGPYDAPEYPEIHLKTAKLNVSECVDRIINHITPKQEKPACMFIGRWNGVFHNGHDYIIQKKLDEGENVILAIRDVRPDEKNPWPAKKVKQMLEYYFHDDPKVKVIIIPDIKSVEYGRGVGYEVNEIEVGKQIAGISGTECRKRIAENDDSWYELIPERIADFLELYP